MQRRAAALYGAFFLVLALGSYGMIAAASAPTVSVDNPDHRLSDGGQFSVDGRAYNASVSDGSATLSWVDDDAVHTTTWEEGADVEFQGTNYTVAIPDDADPRVVRLTEVRPLPDDVETAAVNGTEYVVLEGDGDTRELVPVETYLDETQGEPATRTIRAAQAVDYRGNGTIVGPVENGSATLEWRAPRTVTVNAAEGDVLDLNGVEFVAHFPEPDTLVLDRDVAAYERQLEVQDRYDERINGLWGVSLLSGLATVALLGLSYLPSRY